MQNDFRGQPLFRLAEDLTAAWLRPGSGDATTIAQLAASPDGRRAVGAASISDALTGVLRRDGTTSTRIATVNLQSGDMEILTHGPRSDSAPRWSPDGRTIAFLSDREEANVNRLRIL